MMQGREIVVSPEEALSEIKSLLSKHRLRPILSDKDALDSTIERIKAVLDFYQESKPKEEPKKNSFKRK